MFWWGVVVFGHVMPFAVGAYWLFSSQLTLSAIVLVGASAGLTLLGLYLYEYAYVMAPQEVPNS
jgi:hypothetical protein